MERYKVKFKISVRNEIKRQLDKGYDWARIEDRDLSTGSQSYDNRFLDVPFFIVGSANQHSHVVILPEDVNGMRISKKHTIQFPEIDIELEDDLFEWNEV